ncbi:MAG: LytR/AlgR family response regulator transcription factor [Marinifilaceae bacterium]
MKAFIVEDEPLAAAQLKSMLSEACPEIVVCGSADSVVSAVEWLQQNKPDVIFMDIHLGDGDSFMIFDKVEIECPVIFTTAYDKYALEAFKNKGIDYLLKPFNEEDLLRALAKLSLLLPQHENASPIEATLHGGYQRRFLITVGNKLHTIQAEDIAYFMADGKYLFLYTFTGGKFPIDATITSIEGRLNAKYFFRINRKFIININAIVEMSKFSGSRIKVTLQPPVDDEFEVIVSAERIAAFKEWLNGY